jgi:UbiD family decarboxylase
MSIKPLAHTSGGNPGDQPPPDLRTFLEEFRAINPHYICDLEKPIKTRHEITELQYQLWQANAHPVLLCHRPTGPDGEISQFRLITNLGASREICARVLGLSSPYRAAQEYSRLARSHIQPEIVRREEAPVKEVIETGPQINLLKFPVTWQHERDAGPYLTAGHVSTYDPESGTDNTAIQRCWVKAADRTGIFPYPGSHNYRNMQKFWKAGQAAPVAIWIGHHPAVVLASQAKLGYPESHWPAVGGFLGRPVRLVATETFGEKLLVPADAEIVIEGYVAPELEPEGPFGEFTGYTGGVKNAPLLQITALTYRQDAIYHDYASGLPDMLVADNMALESKIYDIVKAVAPDLQNVHVPISGRRFHAFLQLKNPRPGEALDALTAALSFRRVKHAIAVDSDIDIFDEDQVWWAVATRSQWGRDLIVINGLSGSALDPSLPDDSDGTTSKGGIDATLKPGGSLSSTASRIPEEVRQRVRLEDFIPPTALKNFPGTF